MATTTSPANGSDEREFLHELATPIGTCLFLADCMLNQIQSRPDANKDDLNDMTKLFESLQKITKMLSQRRDILIARGIPSARS